MDQNGLFLMLKMCNGCSHNKGSWKKCMSRRHNPRMSTVREDELTYSHRQCVKPDQAITIYKLHDHETNEDYLEFDEEIIFQTACRKCLNIKSCLREGHKLVDWRPTFAGGRVAGSSHPPASPPASPSAPTLPPPPPPPTTRGGGARRGGGGPGRAPRSARGRSASTSVVDDEMELVEDYGDGGGRGRKVFPAGGRGRRGHAAVVTAGGAPQESTATPRGSHKRKSPASASSAYPRSASSCKGGKSAGPLKGKRGAAARRDRGGSSVSVGGRGRRRSTPEKLGDIPEMEIETDSSEVCGRPRKRRGKAGTPANPAAVTLSPKAMRRDSFAASPAAAACEYDDDEEEEDEEDEAIMIVSDGDAGADFPSPPPVPETVAERLELVKGEEAELLREFEETHKRIAQEEEAKREEMAEFQRAGEAALRAMQKEKEEALQRISAERKCKAAERQELLHKRFKEFEVEEAEFRIEARERDARLEAEKEQLAKDSSLADAAVAGGGGDTSGGDGSGGDGTGGDGTGGDGPEWASDKWILAGMSGSGGGGGGGDKLPVAERPPVYARDEKASAKAAAVARLLAGGVVDASGASGGEPLDKEEGTGPESAEAPPMSEKTSGVSKGTEAHEDVAVPTAMVEDGDETPPPPPLPESATALGDGPAEASGDADGGGVVVPNDTDPEEEDPALAAFPAADDQGNGAKEPQGDHGANGGVVFPADADDDAVAAIETPSVAAL